MDAQIDLVNVTVHRLTVKDKRNLERMFKLLNPVFGMDDPLVTLDLWTFINLSICTDQITGVDFQIPDPDNLFDVWEKAWHKYNALDSEVVGDWVKLANSVNASPNERGLLPPDDLSDEEKKSTLTNVASSAR